MPRRSRRRSSSGPKRSARATRSKTTFGKPFRKKSSKGKFKRGTMIRYKYVNGRRVGAEKSRK
jgi:hypothetical protein